MLSLDQGALYAATNPSKEQLRSFMFFIWIGDIIADVGYTREMKTVRNQM